MDFLHKRNGIRGRWSCEACLETSFELRKLIGCKTYTLLQKKVYTLFPGKYSRCRLSSAHNWLEGQPIRVLQQSSLHLRKNSKWFQSSKERFVGKLCLKVHKNLFLPQTPLLMADTAHASKHCFRTLEPL